MAKHRKYKSEHERRDIVARWKASGLSQAEFCRREQLAQWRLSSWKRAEERGTQQSDRDKSKSVPLSRNRKSGSELRRYWQRIVARQAASGLSAKEFCKREGVNFYSFKRWRRMSSAGRSTKQQVGSEAAVNPFVAVRLDEPIAKDTAIEILLPGGGKLQVTEKTPLTLLSKILQAMEEKC